MRPVGAACSSPVGANGRGGACAGAVPQQSHVAASIVGAPATPLQPASQSQARAGGTGHVHVAPSSRTGSTTTSASASIAPTNDRLDCSCLFMFTSCGIIAILAH